VLNWFRARRTSLGAMLLASLATFGGSIVIPHGDECHDGCVRLFVQHDASAHRFQGAASATHAHPLHCLVCHWARSFRPRQEVTFHAAPVDESRPRVHVEFVVPTPAALAALPPLRSPPNA
jgi:hypothetical protein